jgi:hypothetical protein
MATRTVFLDETNEDSDELVIYVNQHNRLYIEMQDPEDNGWRFTHITLSKEDAIKLVDLINKEIESM